MTILLDINSVEQVLYHGVGWYLLLGCLAHL